MAALYTNENMPFPVVALLREFGHDVLTTAESGNAGQAIPDEEVLSFALHTGRILITLNRKHFIRLHQTQSPHLGIVVCTFDLNYFALAQRIDAALQIETNMVGRLIRVNRPS